MPVKTCEVCSLDFKARLNVVRTCSTQCRNTLISREKSLRHQAVKNCVVCNAEFQVGAVDAIKQTCSKECSYKLRGSKTSKGQMMTCVTCGAGFFTQLSQLKTNGGGTYCSKKCLYDKNKDKMQRACVCCGKMFTSPPSQAHVQTCSTECGYEWFSGERRPNYVGATYRVVNEDGTSTVKTSKWYASKHNTARRLVTIRATPGWADAQAIRRVYDLAARLESETGLIYHVDHIVPLNGKTVSGLHNQFNLQVLPATENIKKSNRHWPDKP
jgi:hypothetical protein